METFNKETMEFLKYAKIALAVLLLLCLFHWPYGYYMFIRFVTMVVFAVMAFDYFGKKEYSVMYSQCSDCRVVQSLCEDLFGSHNVECGRCGSCSAADRNGGGGE